LTIFASVLLTVYLRLCDFGYCKTIPVETAVIAVSSCESGDGHNFNTINWNAISKTNDTGAFQFNDRTWRWLTGREDRAIDAPQSIQLEAFYKLWDNGYGYTHWSASQKCWSQWLEIKDGRAVER
jgi:hypothetical protein